MCEGAMVTLSVVPCGYSIPIAALALDRQGIREMAIEALDVG